MSQFNLREVNVPLFGVVEAKNKSDWLAQFAAPGQRRTIEADAAALGRLEVELGVSLNGTVLDAARYAAGEFKDSTVGLGGTQLGYIGEALAYLIQKTGGGDVVRVVGYKPASSQKVKGEHSPSPITLSVTQMARWLRSKSSRPKPSTIWHS